MLALSILVCIFVVLFIISFLNKPTQANVIDYNENMIWVSVEFGYGATYRSYCLRRGSWGVFYFDNWSDGRNIPQGHRICEVCTYAYVLRVNNDRIDQKRKSLKG